MELKFQYNKTTIQELNKQLVLRQKTLPILQRKEVALRIEVKEHRNRYKKLRSEHETLVNKVGEQEGLWNEFPNVLYIDNIDIEQEKIIGVKVPVLKEIGFKMADFSWWHYPAWLPTGIQLVKQALSTEIEIEILEQQIDILNQARKKTTQKVNLYEKEQIPAMQEAILKIKRFLEDKENISKAGQKIMKKKLEGREVA